MRLYVIVKGKYCKQHIINNPLTHHCISTLQLENAYQACNQSQTQSSFFKFCQVRKFVVRILPTGPQLRSTTFLVRSLPVRWSAGPQARSPHFTNEEIYVGGISATKPCRNLLERRKTLLKLTEWCYSILLVCDRYNTTNWSDLHISMKVNQMQSIIHKTPKSIATSRLHYAYKCKK